MTKAHAALSYEQAQARIAERLGSKRAAAIAGVALRTFYDWGDPDVDRTIPIAAAEKLDRAYLAAGGDCMPFLDTLTLRLSVAREACFADPRALVDVAARFAKEAGEFSAATFHASRPDATAADMAAVGKEGLEAIGAAQSVVSAVGGIAAAARAPPDTG
ncbi:hypothetical protein GCM10022253_28200 [Sphingomonas endophytica]|uniref:Uncharacterized protein n=1 Tax=Sphingomonas endophytica TaxID=869719 RepID=A0ABR6N8L5_9SPHN|nr:hypothetical protein [Sphingomonas endophytica]MBB5727125.1 hypothetical protein [Sphingomonas endophytica]